MSTAQGSGRTLSRESPTIHPNLVAIQASVAADERVGREAILAAVLLADEERNLLTHDFRQHAFFESAAECQITF